MNQESYLNSQSPQVPDMSQPYHNGDWGAVAINEQDIRNLKWNYWLSVFFSFIPAGIYYTLKRGRHPLVDSYLKANLRFSIIRGILIIVKIILGVYISYNIAYALAGKGEIEDLSSYVFVSNLIFYINLILFLVHIVLAAIIASRIRQGKMPLFLGGKIAEYTQPKQPYSRASQYPESQAISHENGGCMSVPEVDLSSLKLNYWLSVFFTFIPAVIFYCLKKGRNQLVDRYLKSNLILSTIRFILGILLYNISAHGVGTVSEVNSQVAADASSSGSLALSIITLVALLLFVLHIVLAATLNSRIRTQRKPLLF